MCDAFAKLLFYLLSLFFFFTFSLPSLCWFSKSPIFVRIWLFVVFFSQCFWLVTHQDLSLQLPFNHLQLCCHTDVTHNQALLWFVQQTFLTVSTSLMHSFEQNFERRLNRDLKGDFYQFIRLFLFRRNPNQCWWMSRPWVVRQHFPKRIPNISQNPIWIWYERSIISRVIIMMDSNSWSIFMITKYFY